MRRKHKKGIAKIIVLMTISLCILMSVNNGFEIIGSMFNGLSETIKARRLEISMSWEEYNEIGEDVLDKLDTLENEHVSGVYLGGTVGGKIAESNDCEVTYVPEEVLEEYMNKKDFTLKDDEVILPKYVNEAGEYIERSEEEYVGKNIEYTIYKKEYTYESETLISPTEEILNEKVYTLRVAGLYDDAKSGIEGMIVSNETLMEMKNFSKPRQDNDSEVYIASADMEVSIFITIDDYKNAEEVQKSINTVILKDYGLSADVYEFGATNEFYGLQAIQIFANLISSFLFVCAILSLFSYIKDMMNRRKQEFGVMKAIGYKTSGICKGLIKELLPEIIIPLGTALILGKISAIVIDNVIKNNLSVYEYAMFDVKLYGNILALVIGMAVGLPILGYVLTVKKISRLEPMEALK